MPGNAGDDDEQRSKRRLARVFVTPPVRAEVWEPVRRILRDRLEEGISWLGEGELRIVLRDAPLPFGEATLCERFDQVAAAIDAVGFPLVMKALGSGAVHKSDSGLVRTNVSDRISALSEARELLTRGALSVQRQLHGIEIAVGARRDELGPLVLVAAGGTLIEVLDDKAFDMAPISKGAAKRLLQGLRVWPLLNGHRGGVAVDIEGLAQFMNTVSEMVVAIPEIAELDFNPVFVSAEGCWAADARCRLAEPLREQVSEVPRVSLRSIFSPKCIAVVGGTEHQGQLGNRLLTGLRSHQFAGELVAINPRGNAVAGIPTYRRLADVPGAIDLTCIAVPANQVPAVVADCVAAGAGAGIIYAAGFAESGEEGLALQRQVSNEAQSFRYVGPNSLGIVSPANRLYASGGIRAEGDVDSGTVAFISQSGAIASSLLGRVREFGLGFSHWISCGNEADLDIADYLDYLVDDASTRVICLFLEVIRRPGAFARASRRALEAGKPVLCLKTGSSDAAREAIASHTAALAGSDDSYSAFFRHCGVLRCQSLTSMFAGTQGLLTAGRAAGRRIGVVTMSGGVCSLMADGLAAQGLETPPLPLHVQDRLAAILPSFGGRHNPIDLTTAVYKDPGMVKRVVEILRGSGAVDLILLQMSTNADPPAAAMAKELVVYSAANPGALLIGRMGAREMAPQGVKIYEDAGIHLFTWPEHLINAASACVAYGEALARIR